MILSTQTNHIFNVFGEKEGIDVFARAGFDAIDFSMFSMSDDASYMNSCDVNEYAKSLRKTAEDAGLHFNQAHAPFPGWRVGDDAYNEKLPPRVIRAIKIAGLLGAKAIVVHPIAVPGGGEKQKEFNLNYYREMEQVALDYGVKIALENMWGWDGRRNYIVPNVCSFGEDLCDYYDELNPEAFTVCLDLGHCGLVGDEADHAIRVLGNKRLGALHVHDNNYRDDTHTLPYDRAGKMNWDKITSALGEIDYKGDLTFEADNFLARFDRDTLPVATAFMAQIGRALIEKIEKARK